MSWPLPQDFNESVQNPSSAFSDPDLKTGQTVVGPHGMPLPRSGNFADVYQVRAADQRDWAVKCFTRPVTGLDKRYAKVEAALADRRNRGTIAALVHAADGASDGIRKLQALARQNAGINPESPEFPAVTALTSAELDLALGRSNVIHAALLAGPASDTFLSRSQMLVRYRMADDDRTVAKNSPIKDRANAHD